MVIGLGTLVFSLSEMEAEEVLVDHVHEVPSHYKVVLDRLNEQRQQEQFTDITLIVDGQYLDSQGNTLWAVCHSVAACAGSVLPMGQDTSKDGDCSAWEIVCQ
eukprot:g34170.t1